MADKKKMSVAEILAAARKADSKQADAPASEAAPPAEEAAPAEAVEAAAPEPAASKPAKPAAPVAKPGSAGRPSVSDILAAARAAKGAEAAPAAKKPAPAAKAPAAKAPAAASAEKPAAKAKPAEKAVVTTAEKDTASILAGAPKGAKPGPMSKAEAAKLNPDAPARAAPPKNRLVVPPMPSKPDYAKPKAAKEAAVEERRGFFSMLFGSFMAVGFTSMTATFGLWTLGTARFMFPNVLTEPPSRFKVGFPNDFPPGSVEEKFKAQFGVWVVNTEYQGKREIFALRTVCTHLGCTPNWLEGEQKFKCPCHGSGFYKDGINFEGPAPRPLERYAIQLSDDGQLEVDKSKLFQEELGQWNDPASFVSV